MKNLIFAVLLAAALWYGYMYAVLEYIPKETATHFVDETRLGLDNGVLTSKFSYQLPLPKEDMTLPPEGISQDFSVDKKSGPGPTDAESRSDSRTIVYTVRFGKSMNAPAGSRNEAYQYRLILLDKGTYFFPEWKPVEFQPADRRSRRRP